MKGAQADTTDDRQRCSVFRLYRAKEYDTNLTLVSDWLTVNPLEVALRTPCPEPVAAQVLTL